MKKAIDIKNKIISIIDKPYLTVYLYALATYVIVEIFARRSLIRVFAFLFTHPIAFVINYLIVLITFSIIFFLKRKIFGYTLVSVLWLTAIIVNSILISQRNSPFNFSDLLILKYGLTIADRYFNIWSGMGLILLTISSIVICIILFIKGHKCPTKPKIAMCIAQVLIIFGAFSLLASIAIGTNMMSLRFRNIVEEYNNNGFAFSFASSYAIQGVEEPENYSPDSVEGIVSSLSDEDLVSENTPNVIVVQLESFFDPDCIKGINFEEDPIPNFHQLSSEGISGKLSVPVVGGGTSNTEFEVLTSMSLDFFGTVEYPYESFLSGRTCESVAYDFAKMGYATSAIHDFSATFYNRNKVYANLGFERFTSLEYMSDVEYNEIDWPKDKILEKYIISNLENSKERDFIFSVSVQGHGNYPEQYEQNDYDIVPFFSDGSEVAELNTKIDFYIKQIHEMDVFIGNLASVLSTYSEPCVLVVYGDHLPGINFTEDMLECKLYETEYFIWANYDITVSNEDLETYQLMPRVQSLIGTTSGVMTRFHQEYKEDENYQKYLQTLEYDLVEGKSISLGNKPYSKSDIELGSKTISISGFKEVENGIYIYGLGFTPYCTVYLDDKRHTCDYIDSSTLFVPNGKLNENGVIEIGVFSYSNHYEVLSRPCSLDYKKGS